MRRRSSGQAFPPRPTPVRVSPHPKHPSLWPTNLSWVRSRPRRALHVELVLTMFRSLVESATGRCSHSKSLANRLAAVARTGAVGVRPGSRSGGRNSPTRSKVRCERTSRPAGQDQVHPAGGGGLRRGRDSGRSGLGRSDANAALGAGRGLGVAGLFPHAVRRGGRCGESTARSAPTCRFPIPRRRSCRRT